MGYFFVFSQNDDVFTNAREGSFQIHSLILPTKAGIQGNLTCGSPHVRG